MNVIPMTAPAVPRLPPGLAAPGPAVQDQPPAGQRTGRDLLDFLEVAATAAAAGSARGHAVHVLREWGLSHFGEAAQAVVSELITNSITATAAINWPVARPPIRLWLLAGPAPANTVPANAVPSNTVPANTVPANRGRVLIAVWDGSPRAPEPRSAGQAAGKTLGQRVGPAADRTPVQDADLEAESGRGLVIVNALSADWGFYYPPEHYSPEHYGGKVTWALIDNP